MNNKYVNLFQFNVDINSNELAEKYIRYLCGLNNNVKYHAQEIQDIQKLIKSLNIDDTFTNCFVYGYVVPQLSKEFDLIKVSREKCVNIELKSESISLEKIKKQLIQNSHYLRMITQNIHLFTYVSSDNTLYKLIGDDVVTIEFDDLKNTISDFDGDKLDLDEYFIPSNILVSPLNSPQKFLEGKYLLTDHQQSIKNKIMEYISDANHERFFGLSGSAGTGKTLLVYDIAKELSLTKKVLIVHSGLICKGHDYISSHCENIKIIEAKELKLKEIKDVDLVIIDEAHRLYNSIFDKAIRWTKRAKSVCIFSYDSSQKMSKAENIRNTDARIKEVCGNNAAELTGKIRTNKNIAQFIKCLFDLCNYRKDFNFENVLILYEKDERNAVKLALKMQKEKEYTYISYTPSTIDGSLNYQDYGLNTHRVIGQEYDGVIMILNHYFMYDEKGILCAERHPNPDYLFPKLLFQGLTRARSKICLIVTKESLLNEVLKLFNYY